MRWIPLEANPEVMTNYISQLGIADDYQFYDVYGLDQEMRNMVPKPVIAVLLLFPITSSVRTNPIGTDMTDAPPGLFFIRQTVGNSCGTVAIVHAVLNNRNTLTIAEDSSLLDFLQKTEQMSSSERSNALEKNSLLTVVHRESAKDGQTTAPSANEPVNLHFTAFVSFEGYLYELDGRKHCPTLHGPTTPDSFFDDTCLVIEKFMARNPDSHEFSVIALAKVPKSTATSTTTSIATVTTATATTTATTVSTVNTATTIATATATTTTLPSMTKTTGL